MAFAFQLIAYLAGVVALVVLGVGGFWVIASSPKEAVVPTSVAHTVTPKPAPEDPASRTADRPPTWIAPTQVYPPSAFVVKNAARARKAAKNREDWRLKEPSGPEIEGVSSYAPQSGHQRDHAPEERGGYREPIQFREKTEPR